MCGTVQFLRQAILIGGCVGLFFCPNFLVTAAAETPTGNIQEMLQSRLQIVQRIQKIVMAKYAKGIVAYDVKHEADISVLKARLDLCETKQDRIKVHEEMVREAEGLAGFVENKLKSGYSISQIDVLKAQAYLLECKIRLEKAKNEK